MNEMLTPYVVVKNDEDQYSIWVADLPLPAGWTAQGEPRDKSACLAWIDEHWSDMRPASLRRHLAD